MALPSKSKKGPSLELNVDLLKRSTGNLNVPNVMYNNNAFEMANEGDNQQKHSHAETSGTGQTDSQLGLDAMKSITVCNSADNSHQTHETNENCPPTSTVTLTVNGVGATGPVTNSTDVDVKAPPVPGKRQLNLQKRVSVLEGENKSKCASVKMDNSRHSTIKNLPRRESGIFLLSSPAEMNISQDSFRNGHSVSRSPSETSEASLRSTSKGSLRSDMLISPEEIWLESLESKLVMVTEGTQIVTLGKFKEALQAKKSFFVDRCFEIFDLNGSGEVSLRFLIGELRSLVYGTQTDKMRFLFNIYNIGGTGMIDASEIYQVLKSCIEESRLHFTNDDLKALTEAFVSVVGKNKDGRISFDDFKEVVEKHPAVAENVAVSTLLSTTQSGFDFDWMEFTQNTPAKRQHCCRYLSKAYIQNNMQKIFFLFVYMIINAGLGVVNGWRYWHLNVWLIVARVCGLCLNFNCTLVVVLMLRRLITYLRATPLVKILPLDQYIMFHKICGYMIAVQSLIHTVAHVGNAFIVANTRKLSVLEVIFTTKANIGWVYGTAPVTGVGLTAVLMIMLVLSMPFVRSRGCFEMFYWSHKLYLIMFGLLIAHAQDFWKWFVVPGVVFMLEAISRISWIRSAYMGRTYIESVCLLPSEVTQLVITKPVGFTFKPGDFVYIQIPAITKYEWHPFTISSAPEQRDTIWLHIRTAGYWTKSLLDYFSRYEFEDVENGTDSSGTYEVLKKCNLKRRASSIAWAKQKPLKARRIETDMRKRVITKRAKVLCHIDGPYGTPSRHIFHSEHAVLVGSGIGITPFASILQSIVNQFKAGCVTCAKCQYTWCHTMPATVMNLRKVDFVWINRDQLHFEWFVSLLTRLEREQEIDGGLGHILDMHMYMTSALPKTDMKGLILQLALDIIHETERTDLITGLQTRTQTGRPDFDVLFQRIQANAKGHVTVFFCGSPLLGKTVKHYTHKYGFTFRHETF